MKLQTRITRSVKGKLKAYYKGQLRSFDKSWDKWNKLGHRNRWWVLISFFFFILGQYSVSAAAPPRLDGPLKMEQVSMTETLPNASTSPVELVSIKEIVIDVPSILIRIRGCESGHRYDAQNSHSTASGAYQFLDSTWNNYKGYSRAKYAPKYIQDERAVIEYNRNGTRPWYASIGCWG